MVSVFSIPAFFIVLREVLEACLVVGIVLAYLDKVGATQYRKWVWLGAGIGVLISLAAGLGIGIYFFVTDEQLFTGSAEKIFEGVAFLVAAGLLTWMIVWMMAMGRALRSKMEQKLDDIVDSEGSPGRRKLSIFSMVFVQVLREGIETVIFLIGTANADEVGGWRAIPLAGVLAIAVGLVVSFVVFKGLVSLDILAFFQISGLILIAFAAGLVSHAFHELQEVDWFGPWETDTRDWYNHPLWSTEGCCDDGENQFFGMLRALFGYQDKPTFVEWATYFGYWFIVICIAVVVNWSQIRASRSAVASRTQGFALCSLLFTFVGWVYTLINVSWVGVLSMTLGFVLSILAVFVAFDVTSKLLSGLAGLRRPLALLTGIGMSALTMFMFVMHLVELSHIGRERDGWKIFFFFGLIYDSDFLEMGRQESSWPPLAALSMSIVITVFFFGALSFLLILFALNVDGQGNYIDDNTVHLKGTGNYDEAGNFDASDSTAADNAVDAQRNPESGVEV